MPQQGTRLVMPLSAGGSYLGRLTSCLEPLPIVLASTVENHFGFKVPSDCLVGVYPFCSRKARSSPLLAYLPSFREKLMCGLRSEVRTDSHAVYGLGAELDTFAGEVLKDVRAWGEYYTGCIKGGGSIAKDPLRSSRDPGRILKVPCGLSQYATPMHEPPRGAIVFRWEATKEFNVSLIYIYPLHEFLVPISQQDTS